MLSEVIDKINDEGITKLDGYEFQELMDAISDPSNEQLYKVWKYLMDSYFDYYSKEAYPVIASWENDYDDVWDAEAAVDTTAFINLINQLNK